MVIHNCITPAVDRESPDEFLQSFFEPILATNVPLAAQERLPNTAGNAVVERSYGDVDDLGTRNRQSETLRGATGQWLDPNILTSADCVV